MFHNVEFIKSWSKKAIVFFMEEVPSSVKCVEEMEGPKRRVGIGKYNIYET